MNLIEFADKILKRYPPPAEDEEYTKDFIEAIDIGGEYDYDKAFVELMRSYSFKTTPPASILIKILKNNMVIRRENDEKPPVIGSIFADKNGYTYCFGIETAVGESATTRSLVKQGFTNLRPLSSYLLEKH